MRRFLDAVERRRLAEHEARIVSADFAALPVVREPKVRPAPGQRRREEHEGFLRRAARIAALRRRGATMQEICCLTGLTERQVRYAEGYAERVAERRE